MHWGSRQWKSSTKPRRPTPGPFSPSSHKTTSTPTPSPLQTGDHLLTNPPAVEDPPPPEPTPPLSRTSPLPLPPSPPQTGETGEHSETEEMAMTLANLLPAEVLLQSTANPPTSSVQGRLLPRAQSTETYTLRNSNDSQLLMIQIKR